MDEWIPYWIWEQVFAGFFWAGLIMLGYLWRVLDDTKQVKKLRKELREVKRRLDEKEDRHWRGTRAEFESLESYEPDKVYEIIEG